MIPKKSHIFLGLLAVTGFCTASQAESPLERQLARAKQAVGAPAQANGGPANLSKPAAVPGWSNLNDGSNREEPCSIVNRKGAAVLGYIGPSAQWKDSYFFVSGPDVPKAKKAKLIKVTLSTDGEADRTVKATHSPMADSDSVILFNLPTIEAALDLMEDRETVKVSINGKNVFGSDWMQGHAARDKMRACLKTVTR